LFLLLHLVFEVLMMPFPILMVMRILEGARRDGREGRIELSVSRRDTRPLIEAFVFPMTAMMVTVLVVLVVLVVFAIVVFTSLVFTTPLFTDCSRSFGDLLLSARETLAE
jgi:hypothetical protein